MKSPSAKRLALVVSVFALVVAGCASTPKPSGDNVSRVFGVDLATARNAALEALAETGFDSTKTEDAYLEGFRPRRVGLVVGSGGETIGVWLTALSADSTRVEVRTAKSLLGIAGQKNWDDPVMSSIAERLRE